MPPQTRLGDNALVPEDGHGCPGCDHECVGPMKTGSPNVIVNGQPAGRVTDTGIHSSCCGANEWMAVKGSPNVKINGLDAHRLGDDTQHCGGMGTSIEGSPNVIVNVGAGAAPAPPPMSNVINDNPISQAIDQAAEAAQGAVDQAAEAAQGALDQAGEAVQGALDQAGQALDQAGEALGDAAGHLQDVGVAAIGVQVTGKYAGRVALGKHHRTGTIAEQHTGAAIVPVQQP